MTIKPFTQQETPDAHSVSDRLRQHYERASNLHMPQLFTDDSDRFTKYSLEFERKATSIRHKDNYFIAEFAAFEKSRKPLILKVDITTKKCELIKE